MSVYSRLNSFLILFTHSYSSSSLFRSSVHLDSRAFTSLCYLFIFLIVPCVSAHSRIHYSFLHFFHSYSSSSLFRPSSTHLHSRGFTFIHDLFNFLIVPYLIIHIFTPFLTSFLSLMFILLNIFSALTHLPLRSFTIYSSSSPSLVYLAIHLLTPFLPSFL